MSIYFSFVSYHLHINNFACSQSHPSIHWQLAAALETPLNIIQIIQFILNRLRAFNFGVHPVKSTVTLQMYFQFLGVNFDTHQFSVTAIQAQLDKLRLLTQQLKQALSPDWYLALEDSVGIFLCLEANSWRQGNYSFDHLHVVQGNSSSPTTQHLMTHVAYISCPATTSIVFRRPGQLLNSVSLSSLLKTAFWHNHTTFTAHYLRDMCTQTGGFYSVGPLTVTQTWNDYITWNDSVSVSGFHGV